MQLTSNELTNQINAAVAEMEQIHHNPAGEGGDLTAEQSERYDGLKVDVKRLKADRVKAQRGEEVAQEQAEMRAVKPLAVPPSGPHILTRSRNEDADRRNALVTWLSQGTKYARNDADSLYRAAQAGINPNSPTLDFRALSKGSNSAGGYTIPVGFIPELERKRKYYCEFRQFCRVKTTLTGENYTWPTVDNTSNTAAGVVLEVPTSTGLPVTGSDPTFGAVTLKSWPLATAIVKMSVDVVADYMGGAADLELDLADLLAEEMGRQESSLFGGSADGSAGPQGIQNGVSAGVNLASGNALTWQKLVDLEHSVDRKYRNSPNCAWVMNDATLAAVKKIADDNNNPIYLKDIQGAAREVFANRPIYVCNDMTSIASPGDNQPLILFGDFSKYVIRDVANSLELVRYNEVYRANRQIGVGLESRVDARWVTTAACKSLNSYDSP